MKNEFIAIKTAAETEKIMKEKSPAKGMDFEDQLISMLEEYASINGDVVDDLTKNAGNIKGCKKGDINYTIKSINKVIAIEAKNRADNAPPKKILSGMEEIKINRSADFVIYLTANPEQLHKQISDFQIYDDDKLVTHFGLWHVALKVVISILKLENSELDGIDKNAVEKEIETILNSVKSFRAIKTAANSIKNEAEKVLSQSDLIKNQINSSLTNLQQLLFSDAQ